VSITAFILVLVCVANFSLGLFVYLRNTQARTGQAFFILTLLINAYALSNYLTDNASNLSQNILFNKLAYLFAFLSLFMAATFSRLFVDRKKRLSQPAKTLLLLGVAIVSALSLTQLVAGGVAKTGDNLVFSQGSLVAIYDIILILLLAAIVRDQYYLIRRGSRLQKNQAKIIIAGFTASIVFAMITNAVIPLIDSSFQTAKFGPPLLSLFLISSVTYAIVKHGLFDVRLIVARSIAYVLSIGAIVGLYALLTLLITSVISGEHLTTELRAALAFSSVISALSFPFVKHFFDRISNRAFYRDAYEPQEFLDELNTTLVSNFELNELLGDIAKTINKYLKSEFAAFSIHTSKRGHLDFSGIKHLALSEAEVARIHEAVRPNKTRAALITDIDNAKLSEIFRAHSMDAMVSLVTHKEEVGYLFLGQKKSGNIYSEQDLKMMEIIGEELAIAIQNALRFEEIKQFNITLQQKVDEATKELQAANAKLKELDEAKDEFISMASHQLRTPLTTIKGYLSMVLEGDAGPVKPKQKEMIDQSFQSASRMVYLIADLLNVSRLQSGKFVIINKPCNLANLVEGEVKQLAEQASQRKIKLAYDKPASFPVLDLDEDKIRQVVMNLLDNALYYTPAGGTVTARLDATPEVANFSVTDTGVGVPKQLQHHLFSKFYRADNARKMRPDGTGLGLYMAKKVITAQGGAVIFSSEEGKGSTFGFSIPRTKS
jgi:signal transduction histidine kinase